MNKRITENIIDISKNTKWKKHMYLCTKCNNVMYVKPAIMRKSPYCRNCSSGMSFGESKAIDIFNKYKIKYTKEKTFPDLKGKSGKKYRFDFYVYGNRDFIIEIDGLQNYNDSDFGKYCRYHDIIKNEYCIENSIPLYRIKYKTGKLSELESCLIDILRKENLIR